MEFLRKLFTKRINVPMTGNNSVAAIELDPSKSYILLVKPGSMTRNSVKALTTIDPERITVVMCS